MDAPLLSLEKVYFAYEDLSDALQEVSVSIFPGEKIAVVGGNGAGKSTFFLCCNGVLAPQKGSVRLKGQEISRKKRDLNRLRQCVGLVFQDPNQQLVGATVEEEVSFGPMNLGLPKEDVRQRVEKAIRDMDLQELRERPPYDLSGGEKKRLSIAGVLAMEPELILLDEPTAFLDGASSEALERILEHLHSQGKTLLVSTHDLDFALRWASRVLVFCRGRISADGAPWDVFSNRQQMEEWGLRPPLFCELAECLKERGVLAAKASPCTLEQLKEELGYLPSVGRL